MLETERLIIREMCPDDVDDIYSIYEGNDLRYMEGLYEDRQQEKEYIADYQKYIYNFYDFGIWLFEEKSTGEIIGRGGVEYKKYENVVNTSAPEKDDGEVSENDSVCEPEEVIELGYIIRRDKQRQGFAYEGLKAILDFVPEHFGIKQVTVRVRRENVASVKLAEKLGFRFGVEEADGHVCGMMELM